MLELDGQQPHYIGLYEESEVWHWVDEPDIEASPSEIHWHPGQPDNNGGGLHYGMIRGIWNWKTSDQPAQFSRNVICEIDTFKTCAQGVYLPVK